MKKTQQQQIRRCELCYAHSGIIRNFTMRTERSCSFSISVPITILSRRHHKIKKLCSDILNMICSEVISSAFHTGKDRRRARKCAAAGEKKEKRRYSRKAREEWSWTLFALRTSSPDSLHVVCQRGVGLMQC
ncbi:uncharacterized protein [Anas platyrhynchos]|uniref:uncharacterized protein isoform X4 n=1 Tax=Anas platyrhynchos TaxID=8839 RepID=UPI003AF2EBFF